MVLLLVSWMLAQTPSRAQGEPPRTVILFDEGEVPATFDRAAFERAVRLYVGGEVILGAPPDGASASDVQIQIGADAARRTLRLSLLGSGAEESELTLTIRHKGEMSGAFYRMVALKLGGLVRAWLMSSDARNAEAVVEPAPTLRGAALLEGLPEPALPWGLSVGVLSRGAIEPSPDASALALGLNLGLWRGAWTVDATLMRSWPALDEAVAGRSRRITTTAFVALGRELALSDTGHVAFLPAVTGGASWVHIEARRAAGGAWEQRSAAAALAGARAWVAWRPFDAFELAAGASADITFTTLHVVIGAERVHASPRATAHLDVVARFRT